MLLVVELSAKNDAAAESAARLIDDYLETLLGAGLLKFRIARQIADATRLVLLEEWTDRAAHEASSISASFAGFVGNLKPLLVDTPRAHAYEIVAAGVTSE